MSVPVLTGLDRIARADESVLRLLRGRRIGLCAHPASVDRDLRHARFVLQDAGLSVCALFGPEHGYGGEAQDMISVEDTAPAAARVQAEVPVYSLYGSTEQALSPSPRQLAGLDAIVIDLQDVGARYYTFVWTAVLVLRAAARAGLTTFVLDRPNPLGGEVVEGGPQRPGYRSFVGLCEVAVRHGMTIGELCKRAQRSEGIADDALQVVTMQGYRRELDFAATGLPWVLPSPNMPTLQTAQVYPGACLLEGTQLSEGRGTTRPFEIWGAPFLDAAQLAQSLHAEGCRLRPLSFTPTFHKHAGERCFGLQVHVSDARRLRSYALYLRLIAQVRRRHPQHFRWRTSTYEFVSDRPAIDLLTGGPEYRALVDADRPLDEWLEHDAHAAAAFAQERSVDLLY